MRVLLFRPPRFVWPFNSETSAFWQPLGLLCLAAAVRRDLPGVEIEVIDAPALKWGWRTVRRELARRRIDVFGVGEETVSAHEGLRAAALAKELHPDCVVVAGGQYYAHAIEATLRDPHVDVVVRGEGELTFVELLRHIDDRDSWRFIEGIAFRDGDGRVHSTPHRRLIADLDSLPFPAYDLIDMRRYGENSRNHPGLVSIEHSRGCIDDCAFCILWQHMGEEKQGSGRIRPHLRTQSPERSFETVHRLYHAFGRRTFGWIDPTFNAVPRWSDRWADLVLDSDLMDSAGQPRTLHTAWVRADCVLRDEKNGILEKLVRAGLRQVMIGVERDDEAGLSLLSKHHNDAEICRAAFAVFREKYPQVFTIGTVIFGLPGDTMKDLERIGSLEHDMGMDYAFLMPLTPNPGTRVGAAARRSGRVANSDYASYNYHTPVCETESLSLRDQQSIYWRLIFLRDRRRWTRLAHFLFREPNARKRRVFLALASHGNIIALRSAVRSILRPFGDSPALYSKKPAWYEQ
jgi:anaerobic magnesium-protoporphyrin IX monomethyl ester cyclase